MMFSMQNPVIKVLTKLNTLETQLTYCHMNG